VALIGYVVGWIIWPLRSGDVYSKLWMPILGALMALFIWSILKQLVGPRGSHDAAPAEPVEGDMMTAEVG
jgi:hypothetical protein